MLTDTKIRSAKKKEKPYRLTDSKGLYIRVSISGSKNWYVRYIQNGKESQVAIGSYPDMTLAEARIKRDEVKKQLNLALIPFLKKEIIFHL
ncbi:MAG: Arm DNA-binding domain-containing protein [Commensalibacter sp.]